jgi:hypothetical protein
MVTLKRAGWIALAVLLAAGSARAQQSAPAAGTPQAKSDAQEMPKLGTVANPVSGFVKTGMARYSKTMVAAAEAMPPEKYGYKPTPEMNSFGHLIMHIAQTNNALCAKISGQMAPDAKIAETDAKMAETDPKDKLVGALKESFEYCTTTLEKVDDSKLGDQMMLFGNRPISRGGAFVALAGSWTDHYATQAMYLRLNGILPPTAQPPKP